MTRPVRRPPTELKRGPLAWASHGAAWPHREHSFCVHAAELEWHVQEFGAESAPVALLVHGTGAATHSWRAVAPLLARSFRVLVPDLPGHGFTTTLPPDRWSLPGVASALEGLLRALQVAPALLVGHSAGGAVCARVALDARTPPLVVGVNAALVPWDGPVSTLFAPLAKVLAATPLLPQLFAWRAGDRRVVERLIGNTGSKLDPEGVAAYARLVRAPGHVAGALSMMANWDLRGLRRELPRLGAKLMLVAAAQDRTVPPEESRRIAAEVPGARYVEMPGLGHLAHEEAPTEFVRIVEEFVQASGVEVSR